MVNIVSFWVPRPEHPLHRSYTEMLELQRASCERLGLRQIVITEPGALPGFATFELALPRDLMQAILVGQWAYLTSGAFDADTVLVGADCLALYDPGPVFDGGFDLAVTTHPFTDCILNTGTIFCPVAAREAVADLWQGALAHVGPNWGDDQRALAEVLQPTLEHGDHRRWGRRVRFLPVPGYNEAPETADDLVRPLFAHFRGPRKDWAGAWYRRFLEAAA